MRTPSTRRKWRLGASVAAVVMVAAAVPAGSTSVVPSLIPSLDLTPEPYIVQSTSLADARTAVQAALLVFSGGSLGADLPLVNGVAASLTDDEVAQLPTSVKLTDDLIVRTSMSAGKPGPKPPPAPANVFPKVTGATAVRGNTGQGVGVAVVDTGIAPLPDFGTRLQDGVDITTGSPNGKTDEFGHGTFVAGLIAGNGASSKGKYIGEAPGANLIPVKVAGSDGETNVSTVIQGLQWIKDNRTQGNIRVINMSLGAIPPGPTALNPLDQAVEAMWRDGFIVVTSAGNNGALGANGFPTGTITSPGDDPLVITVGALNDAHTVTPADDSVAAFSSNGPTSWDGWWKPDLLAPGTSVISVIPTSSTIWTTYDTARIGQTNFIGSGTSFAAAITSGAAAMLVTENPTASPSNVKAALLTTTNAGPAPPQNPFQQGHGVLNVARAIAEPPIDITPDFTGLLTPPSVIDLVSTQAASGWASTTEGPLYPLPYSGLATLPVGGAVFESTAWNSTAWNSTAWNSTAWNSTAWNSTAWNSTAWNSTAWNSTAWN